MSDMVFREYPKTARLNREIIITEKIDGTNAAVVIEHESLVSDHNAVGRSADGHLMFAQSRSKFITPGDDNFGFAGWVKANADELFKLGPGTHYGEWWGAGINKRYPGAPKKFSLFNTARWSDASTRPACCDVVPVLYQGMFDHAIINSHVNKLRNEGSVVWPGAKSEGVCVFHTAAGVVFKVTCEKDESPKGAQS